MQLKIELNYIFLVFFRPSAYKTIQLWQMQLKRCRNWRGWRGNKLSGPQPLILPTPLQASSPQPSSNYNHIPLPCPKQTLKDFDRFLRSNFDIFLNTLVSCYLSNRCSDRSMESEISRPFHQVLSR